MVDLTKMVCPGPISKKNRVTMAVGGGGSIMRDFLSKYIIDPLKNDHLDQKHDGAYLEFKGASGQVMTSDSYVVSPLFFPGGDIGKLSICGTVNDLLMCGAVPSYFSLNLILEEGLEFEVLEKIMKSLKDEALVNDVQIVTGDTKVVEKGHGDGVFIATTGIGQLIHPDLRPCPQNIECGDKILLNGDIGRHGFALFCVREGMDVEDFLPSDCDSLGPTVIPLLKEFGSQIHLMRDLTRGGLRGIVNEIACDSGTGIELWEEDMLISDQVAHGCELFGLDPYSLACEGRFISFVNSRVAGQVEAFLQKYSSSPYKAKIIGEVTQSHLLKGQVWLKTKFGPKRRFDHQLFDPLPRIC